MANTIIIKNSTTSGSVPATEDVAVGELALNVEDRKMYTKNSGGSVVQVGGVLLVLLLMMFFTRMVKQ
jgi:hypothetical protein